MPNLLRRKIAAGALLIPAACTWRVGGQPPKKPSILLIVADDMRYDAMGFINSDVITPNLDRFSQNAVRFKNAFVTTSVCCTNLAE